MTAEPTPFRKSWLLYAQMLIAAWVIGPVLGYLGYQGVQSEETLAIILGGAALIAGPIMVLAAPFMPRPASGACPWCGAKMYQMFGPPRGGYLLCPRCIAYSRADGQSLSLIPFESVSDTPMFAAALPWDDVVAESSNPIALSAQDVVMDKLSELIARKEGVRIIDKWPPGCCVCGGPPTREENIAVTVLLKGRALETKATLIARGIPHCDQHTSGVAFSRVEFATSLFENEPAFGLKFRSHAYREAFRQLNPAKFDRQSEEPLKFRST